MTRRPGTPAASSRRSARVVAAIAAVGLTSTAIVAAGGGTAAAADLPQAQSVGNFVDATLGGNLLDPIAKLAYAQAKAPGSASVQNPLDVTALNAINLPLTGALQLPQLLGIKLGAVTQKAQANVNGESYGQAGAVKDSGGASVGGDNSSGKAGSATIDLTADGLAGNSPISLPGGGPSLAALGGVQASVDGISSLASTPKGYGKDGSTDYAIADVNLTLGSPLLGTTVGQVLGQATAAARTANSLLGQVVGGLTGCTITAPDVNPLSLAGGAITINTTTFEIKVSLEKLLDQLGLNLNKLPANTDLLAYLLNYLTDADGLAKGLQSTVNSLINPLKTQFDNCLTAIGSNPVTALLTQLSTALTQGQTTLNGIVSNVITQVTAAAGTNPLAPLASALKNLLDIGVNVQPNGKAGSYTDPLDATPKQGTPVVDGQTIVRTIELNVAGAAGRGGLLSLALANSAAGPSVAGATTVPSSSPPATVVPATNIPTGIPAGQASGTHDDGLPVLPLVAILMLMMVSGGAFWQYRMRGTQQH